MHPLTAIDLQHRMVDAERREALAVVDRSDDAPAERGRRIRLPRLLRRRVRPA